MNTELIKTFTVYNQAFTLRITGGLKCLDLTLFDVATRSLLQALSMGYLTHCIMYAGPMDI